MKKINKKLLLNIFLIFSLVLVSILMIMDSDKPMSIIQWWKILIFEFLLQGFIEYNFRKKK